MFVFRGRLSDSVVSDPVSIHTPGRAGGVIAYCMMGIGVGGVGVLDKDAPIEPSRGLTKDGKTVTPLDFLVGCLLRVSVSHNVGSGSRN